MLDMNPIREFCWLKNNKWRNNSESFSLIFFLFFFHPNLGLCFLLLVLFIGKLSCLMDWERKRKKNQFEKLPESYYPHKKYRRGEREVFKVSLPKGRDNIHYIRSQVQILHLIYLFNLSNKSILTFFSSFLA